MRIRARTIVVSLAALLILLVFGGITAMGWEVVLGPKARAVTDRKFDVTEVRLARGKYLVEGPAACFHCHTEHDFSQPEYPIVEAKKGAGFVMPIAELNNIAARNITPDPETGLGNWTDDEIARAIREGVRRDGTALFPVMPYPSFKQMDDEDVASIVVYLRTLTPVRNTVPTRQLPFPLEYIVKTIPEPLTQPQPSHPAATPEDRGKYLVTLAECQGCHSAADDRGQIIAGLEFGGGAKFNDPGQNGKAVFSMNITQDASGIAHYDEALFIQVLRTGHVTSRMLNHIMPFSFFRNMTDEDLRDIWAFIKSRPAGEAPRQQHGAADAVPSLQSAARLRGFECEENELRERLRGSGLKGSGRTADLFRFGAGVRLVGQAVADVPERFEITHIDAAAEDFDGRALRADDVAADDALDQFQVQLAPEDQALIPVEQTLRGLEEILVPRGILDRGHAG